MLSGFGTRGVSRVGSVVQAGVKIMMIILSYLTWGSAHHRHPTHKAGIFSLYRILPIIILLGLIISIIFIVLHILMGNKI